MLSISSELKRLHLKRISPRTIRVFCDLLERYKFNFEKYQALNPDLAHFGNVVEGYVRHYITYGASEGRALQFDADLYDVTRFAQESPQQSWRVRQYFLRSLVASCVEKTGNLLNAPERIDALLKLRDLGFEPYLAVGDSHIAAYAIPFLIKRGLLPLQVDCTSGSARGLINPHSRAGYGEKLHNIFERVNSQLSEPCAAIFCFGQVDIEFVYYFKTVEDDASASFFPENAAEFAVDTVSKYSSFLMTLKKYPKIRPCIAAIFPPCLFDSIIRSGYINATLASLNSNLSIEQLRSRLLKFDFPDLATRTKLHDEFNDLLLSMSMGLSFPFINVGRELRGENGMVDTKYMNHPLGADHHLQFNLFNEIIASKLRPVVYSAIPQNSARRRVSPAAEKACFLFELLSG